MIILTLREKTYQRIPQNRPWLLWKWLYLLRFERDSKKKNLPENPRESVMTVLWKWLYLLWFERDSKKGARESQRIGRDFTLKMIILTLIQKRFEIFRSRKKLTRESQKIGRDCILEMIIFTSIRERFEKNLPENPRESAMTVLWKWLYLLWFERDSKFFDREKKLSENPRESAMTVFWKFIFTLIRERERDSKFDNRSKDR